MLPKTLFLVLVLSFACQLVTANAGTDTILVRYRRYFEKVVQAKAADDYVTKTGLKLTATGRWPDLDYTNTSPSFWPTRDHIGRVKIFAVAWTSPASKYYHDERVWQTITHALDNWVAERYQNSNWWVNEIGVPQDMRDVLVLIGKELSAGEMKGALEVLNQHKVRGVGANLLWSADLGIHYGALTGDENLIRRCVDLISQEIKVTKEDGIQPDWSYHQHGPRLQIFHYGLSYLETDVRIAWQMHDTPWSFPQERIAIISNFILNGWQWMSRSINIVPGTIDRAASRQDQLHNADIRHLVPYLDELAPGNKPIFDEIAARQNGQGAPLVGFRAYPRSDFTAYQQKGFAFFLKTISTRTLVSESINTENLKGRLLNNGDAYLIGNGREYYNLLPFWNWNLLPGQTGTGRGNDTIVRTPFSGSVTDSIGGLTAMKYSTSGVKARKMWACYNNKVVCFISGLAGATAGDSLFTALDQSRWQTGVTVHPAREALQRSGTQVYQKADWIHQGAFGYILMQPSTVNIRLSQVNSSWSSINESAPAAAISDSVFFPVLCHAQGQSSAGYVLVPAATPSGVARVAAHPDWQVLSNDTTCQAVRFTDKTIMAAFYGKGKLGSGAREVEVSGPCLVLLTGTALFVSDPLQEGGQVEIGVGGKKYVVTLREDGITTRIKR